MGQQPQGKTLMKTRMLELRAAEGGADARLFVAELAIAYLRAADRVG